MTDDELARIFGDCGAIVRGASALRGTPHFTTPDGRLHTVHLYGDPSGNRISGLYLPQGFSARYEGGNNNQVVATNRQSGEVIVFAHVGGISSQRDLDRNLGSGRVNSAGSSYIGTIAGPNGAGAGYNHSHITIYGSAAGRQSIRAQAGPEGINRITDFSGYGNMCNLLRR